jgi:hypothetical protein
VCGKRWPTWGDKWAIPAKMKVNYFGILTTSGNGFNFTSLILDIFWLKDESLEDLKNLPEPDIIAREIADNLQAALEMFSSIYEELDKP